MKKFVKWKELVLTCIVCILPMFFGIAVWDKLPDEMAIHFDLYNNPDNYASKSFAIFGLPFLMVFTQLISCLIYDINAKKYGERKKFEKVVKWIIPILSLVLQVLTISYALGKDIDIRIWAMVLCGLIFIAIGNYLPKFDYINHHSEVDKAKARKINRFIGYTSVIMGILAIISVFLPPVASAVWIILLIPYSIAATAYSVLIIKKK